MSAKIVEALDIGAVAAAAGAGRSFVAFFY
jgi:hypothetical protein